MSTKTIIGFQQALLKVVDLLERVAFPEMREPLKDIRDLAVMGAEGLTVRFDRDNLEVTLNIDFKYEFEKIEVDGGNFSRLTPRISVNWPGTGLSPKAAIEALTFYKKIVGVADTLDLTFSQFTIVASHHVK